MPLALVVDDDPDCCALIRAGLERRGFHVLVEHDGEAGLSTAAALRPDLAVLDWMLPHRSGLELCRMVRQSAGGSRVGVLMVSAQQQEYHREWAFAAGADDLVPKPFVAARIADRAVQVLADRAGEVRRQSRDGEHLDRL